MENGTNATSRCQTINKIGTFAALLAAAALLVELALVNWNSASIETRRASGFIVGCIVMIACLVTFITAIFADKRYRKGLIVTSVVLVLVQFVAAFANFGA